MRRFTLHSILALSLLLAAPASLEAQQASTLYLMHRVPQSNLLNPAVQIPCKVYVGIPLLTSLNLNYGNTAFSYQDLASGSSWDIETLAKQVHRSDLYQLELDLQLLNLGYKRKGWYFTFNIAERLRGFATVPGKLVALAVHGNYPQAGKVVKLDGLRPGGLHYREYALGISKQLGPYLSTGIRAKLLFGKAGLSSGKSQIRLQTNEDNFALNLEALYRLNVSFPITLSYDNEGLPNGASIDDIMWTTYLLNRGNPGFAIDLGTVYKYNEELSLSASILDLGFIRWGSNLSNLEGEGVFEFSGVDLSAELTSPAFVQDLTDSLLNAMDATASQEVFTTMLPLQIYLGASYELHEKLDLGIVNRNVFFRSKWHASFTLSASTTLAGKFSAVASWSYLNNSIRNLGVGLAWHGRGVQVHASSDNVLGYFYPFNTRSLNLRLGINLMLGCPRDKSGKLREPSNGPILKGYCPQTERPEKIRKRREKAVRRSNRI